ncbi:hypothetical protein Dvina_23580 [Dactylosporangium vinaceum]|uniref:Integral membrane protein n=1 Tax=Dactylosporangium vinaceum TaxID=53362 RepID=A0ABV5MD01_9ACTN|nr:hypothetical protein [Dactylosporangium vinaceum]UAC00766.1 hypothetical protein Dvina_23580 [Dactylosporangium vinaceum]
MTAGPVVYNIWFILGVFISNGIGCVLSVFCLVRMTDARRSFANRAFLVLAAAWGIVETARDDALFVIATAIHLRDDSVVFYLAPSLALTVVSIGLACAVLGVAAANPRPVWTVTAGATVGLLTGGMAVQAVLAGRSGYAVSIDVPAAVATAAGLAAVTAAAVFLATGATARWRMTGPILVLALCMTVAQYLLAAEVNTDLSAVEDNAIGMSPLQLIFICVAAFGVRTIVLTLLSITDEGKFERAAEYAGTRRAPD